MQANAAHSVDIDFGKVADMGNGLLDRLRLMRETDPLYWSQIHQAWIATGHDLVVEGFRGHLPLSVQRLHMATSSMPPEERAARLPYMQETLPNWIINMDPPGQVRLRGLIMKAFSRKVAEELRPFARQVVHEILDRLDPDEEIEFVHAVSRELPQRVILRMMGLPAEYQEKMARWVATTTPTLGGYAVTPALLDRCEAVLQEMRADFMREIAYRRRNPTEDFISQLVLARDGSDRLSEEEMLGICYVALLAGHNTTANTIALGTAALAMHPEAADFIRDNPDKTSDALMELMRYIAMSAAQVRIVTEDFEWHGRTLRRGQSLFLMIAAANRDPSVFPDPDRLDPTRKQDANMTFAPGLHFCIGHFVAKMQLSEFFPEFLRRFDPEMVEDRLDFATPLAFRGLNTLRLRLHRR